MMRPQSTALLAVPALALLMSLGAMPALGQPVPPGWTLVWSDEFNGTALDGAKWRAENAALVKNNEQQYYSPANVTVGAGQLTILAERRVQGGRPYTSGLIESRNRFSQAFGRFEVRARLPSTRGLWPAIWMLPQAGGWPPEIDIMELLGHQPNTVYMSHHWGPPTAVATQTDSFTGPNFAQDFHVFAAEWFPERIDYYVDGVLRARHTQSIPRDPMYLIINTAVGGNWPGFPDQTTILPQTMLVDYARVYRRNLLNESFDDLGPGGNQPLTGWATYGNAYSEPIHARTGPRSGKMFGNFTGGPNTTGLSQQIDVQPGQRWRGSGWWFNAQNDRMQGANRAVMKFEWLTSAGAVIGAVESTALDAASARDVHLPASVAATAPTGATRLRLSVVFVQPALAAGAAFFDDLLLEQLPVCSTDFNDDGLVSPDDLDEFITTFFTAPPLNLGADFNHDGLVSPDDLDEFITAFFTPCP
ncbi:MAG: family 16 glycosylhydrolase [Phycisphaerales bacterium]